MALKAKEELENGNASENELISSLRAKLTRIHVTRIVLPNPCSHYFEKTTLYSRNQLLKINYYNAS